MRACSASNLRTGCELMQRVSDTYGRPRDDLVTQNHAARWRHAVGLHSHGHAWRSL